jgi:hypothetical protein
MKLDSPFLIPPKRFEALGGFFSVEGSAQLLLCTCEPEPQLMRFLEEALPLGCIRKTEQDCSYSATVFNVPAYSVTTRANDAEWAAEEGFVFTIQPHAFTVKAETLRGLWRGCAFMKRELLRGKPIPCGEGADAPDKRVRGLMLDVSRNRTYSLPTLFGLVDQMALLGLNRLELYFEKAFAFSEHFEQWGDVSPYAGVDCRILSAYCAVRGIELVPNQNTLGHFERWLKNKDYAQCHAELPEGGARTPWGAVQKKPTGLWAANPATREFVKQLLHEVAGCFQHAQSINLGGDEVFDLAEGRSKGCDKATLYLDYMREMAAAVEGLRPELWADMLIRHPEMLPKVKQYLPQARWLVWGYEATDPLAENAAKLRAAGLDVIVCPGTSSWRSFCGRTTNMLANIRAAAAVPDTDGVLLADWGDAGHWQPLTISMPAIVAAAAYAWRADAEIDVAALTDLVLGEKGLGDALLRLGDTYRTAKAEAGNATKLFQAYNLPLADAPTFDTEALQATLAELNALAEESAIAGLSLAARETRYALELQRLAVLRALKTPGLQSHRARVAEMMKHLWCERGPRALLDASLQDFLSVEMP